MPFVYPSYQAVMEAHERIIKSSGGELGMLSPSNLAYIMEAVKDVAERMPEKEAATKKSGYLLYSIVNRHPFLDGNKRTAFELAKNFLKVNGWLFDPEEQEAFDTLLSVARGEMGATEVELWIGRNLKRAVREK